MNAATHAKPARPAIERLSLIWILLATAMLALSRLSEIGHGWHPLTNRFAATQDFPVLIGLTLAAAALFLAAAFRRRLEAGLGALAAAGAVARPWAVVWAIAGLTVLVGWVGCWLVLDAYPLSMDEFMAAFGARIIEHGQLAAPVPGPWRPFAGALMPIFGIIGPGGAWWTSGYLPVNSALRALGGLAHAETLVNPILAGVSVIAIYGVGRRLWPERQDLALMATLLLATSSQFLVTAMTAYAMTAHLALNLVWLWLFLRGGRLGHAGAIAVGFLACGAHQLVFHPLFAAPFILQLFLERRWRLGAVYALAYAAICLGWVEYWRWSFVALGGPAAAGAATQSPPPDFLSHVLAVFAGNDPGAVGLMAMNVIRFITWQNPLVAPLLVLGAVSAFRAGGAVRSLLLGLVLTVVAMSVLMAYQGHGWGYRYLHGLLGSAALLAARAWGEIMAAKPDGDRRTGQGAFLAVALSSILVLFPVRLWQAHAFVDPYARAHAAIGRTGADIVLVDDTLSWFTIDLARNDSYLTNRPLVMRLAGLAPVRLRALCARHTLALFDTAGAARFGIWTYRGPDERNAARLAYLAHATCGGARVGEVN